MDFESWTSSFGFVVASGLAVILMILYPTRSAVRQWLYLLMILVTALISGWHFAEVTGRVSILEPAQAPLIMVGLFVVYSIFALAILIDFYINFETLQHDRAFNFMGRRALAGTILLTAVIALSMITAAWWALDPTILVRGHNQRFLVTAGDGPLDLDAFTLFALDQTVKAALFDVTEVFAVGLIDLSNNPEHIAFSLLCLAYRTFLATFVLVIAYRLVMAPRAGGRTA